MKKIIGAGLIAAVLVVGSFAVNAADAGGSSLDRAYGYMIERSDREYEEIDLTREERRESRKERHEARINEALENGDITEEEASEFRANFNEMKDHHEKDGFGDGNCHGGKDGKQRGHGMNKKMMHGNGMMGRNRR